MKCSATTPAATPTLGRRGFIGLVSGLLGTAALACTGIGIATDAHAASDTAQKIADHFSSVTTMTGEFVQFGPKGEQTGGKFYLQRPGKVRFNYEAPSAYEVVSDGKSVAIDNSKLDTMDLYPLSKTPLKLLLDTRIDLSAAKVKSVKEDEDLTTIQLADKSIFGSSTITMMFDPKSYELRQWTITDSRGKDTTIMIFNVKQGVKIDPATFEVDYERNLELNAPSRRQKSR
jgi:outer membrane lipoprotein-sorting protein